MLKKVWEFFKNPQYIEYPNEGKARIFVKLVILTVAFSLVFGLLMEGITSLVGFEYENHAVFEMFEQYSTILLFFLIVILAPVLEELLFRAPLGLFRKSKYFNWAFYTSVFLFGIIHSSNYQNLEGYYWLIPILVAPQISAGVFLGFIRTKLGLLWSILLHAAHNLILLGPFMMMKMLDIPFE